MIETLFSLSLGSLTLGSLGFGSSPAREDKLPRVAKDSQNKLVLHGSGNEKSHKAKAVEKAKSAKVAYPSLKVKTAEKFREILKEAKETKDFDK